MKAEKQIEEQHLRIDELQVELHLAEVRAKSVECETWSNLEKNQPSKGLEQIRVNLLHLLLGCLEAHGSTSW